MKENRYTRKKNLQEFNLKGKVNEKYNLSDIFIDFSFRRIKVVLLFLSFEFYSLSSDNTFLLSFHLQYTFYWMIWKSTSRVRCRWEYSRQRISKYGKKFCNMLTTGKMDLRHLHMERSAPPLSHLICISYTFRLVDRVGKLCRTVKQEVISKSSTTQLVNGNMYVNVFKIPISGYFICIVKMHFIKIAFQSSDSNSNYIF